MLIIVNAPGSVCMHSLKFPWLFLLWGATDSAVPLVWMVGVVLPCSCVSLGALVGLVGCLTACLNPGLQHSSIITWSQAAWKSLGWLGAWLSTAAWCKPPHSTGSNYKQFSSWRLLVLPLSMTPFLKMNISAGKTEDQKFSLALWRWGRKSICTPQFRQKKTDEYQQNIRRDLGRTRASDFILSVLCCLLGCLCLGFFFPFWCL